LKIDGGDQGKTGDDGKKQYRDVRRGPDKRPLSGDEHPDDPQTERNPKAEGPDAFGLSNGQEDDQDAEAKEDKMIHPFYDFFPVHFRINLFVSETNPT
jgi:hypothetical protein